jgi:hypothetical protein
MVVLSVQIHYCILLGSHFAKHVRETVKPTVLLRVRLEIFTDLTTKTTKPVSLDVTRCSLVEIYRPFGGMYLLHLAACSAYSILRTKAV